MEYFKHKTLSIYIWLAIFLWPLLHYTVSPANQAILTFIAFMCDFVVTLNKNRLMVYAEYKLIKHVALITLRAHCWLLFIIFCRICQLMSTWLFIMCIHKFSPLIGTLDTKMTIILIYICIVLDIMLNGIYIRCYKKWIISYDVVSTYDTELPLSAAKADD